jgi:hypothetical protein
MSVNSIRQTVSVVSNWRSDLKHIKEAKAKADERNRRKQKRSNINKKNSNSFSNIS